VTPDGGRSAHVPFGRAKAGATPKQRLLFRLMQGRVHLLGAYQGLSQAQLVEPMGERKGSVRDAIAHITCWEIAVVDVFPAALEGLRPAMMDFGAEDLKRWSEEQHERTRGLTLDETLRGFQITRLELLDRVEGAPEDPAEMWAESHPVGWMLDMLARNDDYYADLIKAWRGHKGY